MSVLNRLARFAQKAYRDTFLETATRGSIAFQMQSLRRKLGLSQAQFAERTGKKQSAIARLENTDYGRVSVQTLLEIATSLDVAILVRFVSYPEFLARNADMSDRALQPDTIFESLERGASQPAQDDRTYLGVYQHALPSASEQRPREPYLAALPPMTLATSNLARLQGTGGQQPAINRSGPPLQRQPQWN